MKELPLSAPAKGAEDVFIPLDSTVAELKENVKLQKGAPTFIRAPVASGKSTLALHLATKYKDDFVMAELAEQEEDIRRNIVDTIKATDVPMARGKDENFNDTLKALAASNKTLIFDEAHLIFAYPSLVNALFKTPQLWMNSPPLKILLFSAADEYTVEQSTAPPEIRKKYMWYPPLPDAEVMAERLIEASVLLDAESVLFS